MFTNPEYASYIALCRELRLEREFAEGDWYAFAVPTTTAWPVALWTRRAGPSPRQLDRTGMHCAWLPRLDQWLSKLEEAGYGAVTIGHAERVGGYHAFVPATSRENGGRAEIIVREGHLVTLVSDNVSCREEAVARLWLAVTATPIRTITSFTITSITIDGRMSGREDG